MSVAKRSADSSIVTSDRWRRSSSSWPRPRARSKIWEYPLIPVKGVRSSCEAIERNSSRVADRLPAPRRRAGRCRPPSRTGARAPRPAPGRSSRTAGLGSVESERDDPERPPARQHRDADHASARPSPRTASWWRASRVIDGRTIVRELADELRHAAAQDLGDALRALAIRRVLPHHVGGVGARRVGVGHFDAADVAVSSTTSTKHQSARVGTASQATRSSVVS